MNAIFKDPAATFGRLMAHRSGILNVTPEEWTALADTGFE
jgi:hypothetical protein